MAKDKSGLTPMQVQYNEIKRQYSDCLLLYRMGDFYEMFGDDAIIGAKALDIQLTSRSRNTDAQPMCGVPYHAAENYIARLIEQGFKVAICDQMEDPKLAKGLVKREVTRVITPGTVIDDSLLRENAASYLAAVFPTGDGYGLAYADMSTGEFLVAEASGAGALSRVGDELAAIDPKECILPRALLDEPFFANHAWNLHANVTITPARDEIFVRQNAETLLMTQFKLPSMQAMGLDGMPGAVQAAAALLYFFQMTQMRELSYINRLQVYNIDNYLVIDANTRRNLELTQAARTGKKSGSLFGVCDKCRTAAGSRLLKKWLEKPLLDSRAVNLRLDGIEELLDEPRRKSDLRERLRQMYDMERIVSRVVYGNATPRDLLALKASIAQLPGLETLLVACHADIFQSLYNRLDTLEDVWRLLNDTLYDPAEDGAEQEESPRKRKEPDMIIRPGYNAEIDELRHIRADGGNIILEMEAREKERTGIKSLHIGYNKVFGYYIEVTKTNLELVPAEYIRKQTLVGSERFITEELKELENRMATAADRLAELEAELLAEVRQGVIRQTARIQKSAKVVAWLDVLAALGQLAEDNSYVKPQVDDSDCLILQAARHPVVEQAIGRENYIPNDTYIKGDEHRFGLITGPNMAGKSTYMRQVALCVILARIGSYIPAAAGHIGRIDRIFTRVGASDDLSAGQSTFMVEMSETSNILKNATRDSLIILDEIGRGTSTYDGLSIAWAVSEYILQPGLGAKALFATHYHELIELAAHYPQVQNYSVAVLDKGDEIVFLRKIVEGGADKSYGVHVAKLAGLPDSVIARADEILAELVATDGGRNGEKISGLLSETAKQQPKAAANPVLDEMKRLDVQNMRPVEALLYIEKWQKELNYGEIADN